MNLIIEASLQQENKMLIGQITKILKNVTRDKPVTQNTMQVRYNDNNYNAMLRCNINYSITNIRVSEVSNTLYFLGDMEYKTQNAYYDYWSAYDLYRDPEELVLDFVKYYANTKDFISSSDKNTKASLVKAGLDKINCNKDKDIVNSDIYKNLLEHLKEIYRIKISSTLKPEVCKRLKERDNVIPIMWIDAKDGVLNYPSTVLRSSNLMSSSPRSRTLLRYLKTPENRDYYEGYIENAIRYVPYKRWLSLSCDKVSDEINHYI